MKRTLTDAERIASIREVREAARGDWHEATSLLSVQADINWLLERAAVPEIDVERVRSTLVDDIGAELSRALAQGDPFEPFDRLYVAKTITRVLDAARDRIRLAAGHAATAPQEPE